MSEKKFFLRSKVLFPDVLLTVEEVSVPTALDVTTIQPVPVQLQQRLNLVLDQVVQVLCQHYHHQQCQHETLLIQ